MQGARTLHGSRKYKGGSRKQKNAYCASARSGYRGASIISCVTAYFLLHASDFVRRFPDRSQGMTGKRGATPYPLPTLHTIRARKITTAVTVAPTHNPTPSVIPCRVRAPCMEVGSIKVEVGSRKMHIAPVHGAGIAALLLFRASLHTSFFMLPTSLPVASLV